jgi:hypothetical protein
MMNLRKERLRTAAALATMAVIGAAVAGATVGGEASTASAAPKVASGCNLGNGIQHVIQIAFDNTHYNRDNPNVLSDLEQMPALRNFITNNGTLLSNMYTPLIAHTADDTLTNYSGLYGDRHGQGLTNTYETYSAGGTVTAKSSFAYWTGTYGLDAFPNMPYSPKVPAFGATPSTPPAPWVPFTRAGCDVGDVSTANMVLENLVPDLANVFGPSSPEVQQYDADGPPTGFHNQETNDYVGLGVHCAQGSAFCADAEAVKFGQVNPSHTAVTDSLPDEPGGYSGFQALFGHKYLQPQLAMAANQPGGSRLVNGHTYQVVNASGNLVDLNGNEIQGQFLHTPGFPGFGPISAAQSLAYVADMQETGVKITYAYISDAHERKPGQSGCSNTGTTQGPGDVCYKANLAAYNTAFATFFHRLADDGINPSNTLFIITADEGDHFAGANVGRKVTPSCSGTPGTLAYSCTYGAATIGEQQVSIHGLLQNQRANSTPFYNEPQGNSVFITGNPGPNDPATRQLERDFAKATVFDSYDNVTETVALYQADPAVEQLLHFVNADPNRTPSFTMFPRPDFYLTDKTSDNPACVTPTTPANAAMNCRSINNGFSWDHGYYAPEIVNTWLGLVGPGVAHKGVDGFTADQGPNSADGANSDPDLATEIGNPGTWADMTDIRPTMLALVGLKDDYIGDGRVLTEDLVGKPGKTGDARFQPIAACYKQLNASVGEFGTSVLLADTAALETGSSSDDSTYVNVLSKIKKLGAERDALATQIKNDLFAAEFENTSIPKGNSSYAHCKDVIRKAGQLANSAG